MSYTLIIDYLNRWVNGFGYMPKAIEVSQDTFNNILINSENLKKYNEVFNKNIDRLSGYAFNALLDRLELPPVFINKLLGDKEISIIDKFIF